VGYAKIGKGVSFWSGVGRTNAEIGTVVLGLLHAFLYIPAAQLVEVGLIQLPQSMRERFQIESGGNPGGMGVVYRARDKVLNRVVALKHIECTDASLIDALVSEARIVAGLESPFIVSVLDLVVDGHSVWIVSEWIQGKHFADLRGPCGNFFLAAIALQCVQGLAAIHARKIIHRDVKPENMMLSELGTVRYIDFGVAFEQQTKSGRTIVGTLKYMHPSILQGGRATPETDRYALGLILVELFSGQALWPEQSMLQMCRRSVADIRADVRKRCAGMLPPMARLIDQLISAPADFAYAKIIASLEKLTTELARLEGFDQNVAWAHSDSCDINVLRLSMLAGRLLDARPDLQGDRLRKSKLDLGPLHAKPSEWRFFQNQFAAVKPSRPMWKLVGVAASVAAMTFIGFKYSVREVGVAVKSQTQSSPVEIPVPLQQPEVAEVESPKNLPSSPKQVVTPVVESPKEVKLRFTSNTWADVKIDGKPAGRIPSIQPLVVTSGKHKFEFSGTMVETQTQTLDIPKKANHVVDVQLERRLGSVTVESQRQTEIRVAGKSLNVQGQQQIRVPFGQHEIEVIEDGKVKERRSVAIVPNADSPKVRLN